MGIRWDPVTVEGGPRDGVEDDAAQEPDDAEAHGPQLVPFGTQGPGAFF